jgi:UbiD family decarboxylase
MRDTQTFVNTLRSVGELAEIEVPVSTELELAEIHRRVIAANGPALLFKNPVSGSGQRYDFPVATNLFGTAKRVDIGFGRRPTEFVKSAVELATQMMPPTLGKLWGARDIFLQGAKIGMKRVGRPPVLDVIQETPNLSSIPMIKSWPMDGGSFVTLPLVYTEHPETGVHNLGMYRVQRHSECTTGMHWQIGKGGGFHAHAAAQLEETLPVTVFIGGPPALILSAIAPLPENVPELMLASLLVGERLRMGDGPVGPYPVVADAEFALIGHVKPNEVAPEGPFGDHYGYYSLKHDYPVFHVDAIAHRKGAIYPATVVGKPRQEDVVIGDYLQELLSPLFPIVMPTVLDLWTYGETGYHALASARVRERFGREALSSAFRILGEGQLALTKFLWLVDGPVNLRKPKEVLPYLLARFRPETDLYVLANVSMDTLDYAGPEINKGSKGVMVGVGAPWRELPKKYSGDLPAGIHVLEVFCPGVLVVQGPTHTEDPSFGEAVAKRFSDWPFVAIVDDAKLAASSDTRFLWTVFTRFEPAADITSTGVNVLRHHICYEGAVVIDARMKAPYPDELLCDDETRALVDKRWLEYFPDGTVEMGDSDAGHLDA